MLLSLKIHGTIQSKLGTKIDIMTVIPRQTKTTKTKMNPATKEFGMHVGFRRHKFHIAVVTSTYLSTHQNTIPFPKPHTTPYLPTKTYYHFTNRGCADTPAQPVNPKVYLEPTCILKF